MPLALELSKAGHIKSVPLVVTLASCQQDKDAQLICFQSYFSYCVKKMTTQIVINFYDQGQLSPPLDYYSSEGISWFLDNMNYRFDSALIVSKIAKGEPANFLGSWPKDSY